MVLVSYGMFLANNKAAVQRASGVKSMPVLSRRLGQMWAGLSAEEKQVRMSTVC